MAKKGRHQYIDAIDHIASGSMWSGERLYMAYEQYIEVYGRDCEDLFDDSALGLTKKQRQKGITPHEHILNLCKCPRC